MARLSVLRRLSPWLWAGLLLGVVSLGMAPDVTRPPRNVQFGPNIMLGRPSNYEPAIAVNPVTPANLAAGFFDRGKGICRSAFTSDGGTTWSTGGLPPQPNNARFCGDPSLGADLLGNFYYAYVNTSGDLEVAKSTDGGRSYATSSIAATFLDKPYMAVDGQTGSLFQGNIYAGYVDFSTGGLSVVTSRDHGATWSVPTALAIGFTAADGILPVVASNGTVYMIYMAFDQTVFGSMSMMVSKSKDGGANWSQPSAIATNLPSLGDYRLRNGDRKFGTMAGPGIVATSFPAAAVAPDGTLFVAWTDFPQGSCTVIAGNGDDPCTNADVRLSVSRDGGATWTAPVKVSDESNSTDQMMPWMATHPDGLLSIVWLDRRLDPNNIDFNAFYTNTYDGVTFLPNVRVSSATSLVGNNTFIGDYNGIAATADAVFPIWDDVRTGKNSIFTARGTFTP